MLQANTKTDMAIHSPAVNYGWCGYPDIIISRLTIIPSNPLLVFSRVVILCVLWLVYITCLSTAALALVQNIGLLYITQQQINTDK